MKMVYVIILACSLSFIGTKMIDDWSKISEVPIQQKSMEMPKIEIHVDAPTNTVKDYVLYGTSGASIIISLVGLWLENRKGNLE